MPTYVYHCRACDKTFEADQRITEDPLTSCECGSEGTVKRVIQPIAVMFKGSGFHINDYAAKPVPSSTESKSDDTKTSDTKTSDTKASETNTSESGSTESKPAEAKPAEAAKPAPEKV